MKIQNACYLIALSLAAFSARAAEVTVDLGASAQNFVEYGLGADASGSPTWDLQQGTCVGTVCTLSGTYTGPAGFTGGNYSLVTSFTGSNPLVGTGIASNPNYFYYSSISPSTSIVLTLDSTASGTDVIPLVTDGKIVDPNFNFVFTTYACSGTAVSGGCSPEDVGWTNGAIGQGPVTGTATFDVTSNPGGPTSGVPEPRLLESFGLMMLVVVTYWQRKRRVA